ncbi:MAG: phosphonoacetaldehyde dehydrogenase [Rhodospirillaceae bacterium]|nr:MAG: phosphonoacetaldehyde dehydrogenase [Rhodospirillaceae bacterium]
MDIMGISARKENMRTVVNGTNDRSFDVYNPYTEEVIGSCPKASVAEVQQAFEIAKKFKPNLSRADRSSILRKTADLLVARKQEIAELITAESGLCLKDTIYEVGRAYDVFFLSSTAVVKDDGEIFSCDITPHGKKRRIYTQRDPLLGAISAITPFNHPLNQVAHKIAPAIATNNRMVLKPSEKTPLTALLLADVLYEAGLPKEMFQVITGDPAEIADTMLTDPNVEVITFTGGVRVGKYIAEHMGYRRAILELGGNDPLIVMEDADLDEASNLAVYGSYKNSGQRCTAVKRMIVHEAVADRFVELLVEKTRKIKYGDPMDPDADMGTVIDEASARYCEDMVNDAVKRGAKLLHGNIRKGALYSPTVVDHVAFDAPLVKWECFGPVSPIIRVKDIDHAIQVSNSTSYGLSSGVCTNRLDYITRFVRELEVGTVNVREVPGYRIEMSPFGGIKDSGLGYKEGVIEAMKGFTNVKTYSLPWA